MALGVLITGRSGSGKSYSVKTFSPDEVGVISVERGGSRLNQISRLLRLKNLTVRNIHLLK